jgi:hypothetical protein
MDKAALKQLEQANPIVQVAIELGLSVRRNQAKCFRSERHGDSEETTLFFDVARNRFFCQTCQDVAGDVIDFVCQSQEWDRQKAIDWLSHRIEFDQKTRSMYYGRGKKKN